MEYGKREFSWKKISWRHLERHFLIDEKGKIIKHFDDVSVQNHRQRDTGIVVIAALILFIES